MEEGAKIYLLWDELANDIINTFIRCDVLLIDITVFLNIKTVDDNLPIFL